MNRFNTELDITKFISNFFEGVIITDATGQIRFINEASLGFFPKLSLSDLIGKPIHRFIFSKDLARFYKNRQQMRNISLQIGLNHLLANFRKIDTDTFVIILKNNTQIYQLNNELNVAHEQIRLFNQVLDHISNGLCFINTDGNIVFYNKKMGELDSKEPEGVRKQKYATVFNKTDGGTDPLLHALKTEHEIIQHESFFASNGKKYNVLRHSRPLFLGNKKIGALSVVKDYSKANNALDSILGLDKGDKTLLDKSKEEGAPALLYSSEAMEKCVEAAKLAVTTGSHMLIHGPRGVGKSLLVHYLQHHSASSEIPFYTLDCGATPDHLLEKALFGEESPLSNRTGLFEMASGGVIFLKEIEAIGLPLQDRLVRVVRDQKMMRSGTLAEFPIDVRIVASMNLTPATAFEEKLIAEDLLYYLSSVSVQVPALKDRKEDIPILVTHFKEQAEQLAGQESKMIHPETLDLLVNYTYPGNVQQLKYIVESVVSLSPDDNEILPGHLPAYIKSTVTNLNQSSIYDNPFEMAETPFSLTEQVEAFEKAIIHRVLKKTNYHVTNSAEALGLSRQSLNYKIKKYDLPIIRGGD